MNPSAGAEDLFERHVPLAVAIALSFRQALALLGAEETRQEALIGLWQACQRFDPSGIPAGEQEIVFGRFARLRVRGAILDAMRDRGAPGTTVPLDVFSQEGTGENLTPPPRELRCDPQDTEIWRAAALRGLLASCSERDRYILQARYAGGCVFEEIARVLGVSPGRVSQIHARLIRDLRRSMGAAGACAA